MFYELDQNVMGDAKCLVFTPVGFFKAGCCSDGDYCGNEQPSG